MFNGVEDTCILISTAKFHVVMFNGVEDTCILIFTAIGPTLWEVPQGERRRKHFFYYE